MGMYAREGPGTPGAKLPKYYLKGTEEAIIDI
jgi:hypothetical protein